ncbi:hypothetical protein [Actinomyces faecalis]|nr:hypothetical protein [Actinomyces faecalis]
MIKGPSKHAFKTRLTEQPRTYLAQWYQDHLYSLPTSAGLLTDKQQQRLGERFAGCHLIKVEATSGVYQTRMMAYHDSSRPRAKAMTSLVKSISSRSPTALVEVTNLRGVSPHAPTTSCVL